MISNKFDKKNYTTEKLPCQQDSLLNSIELYHKLYTKINFIDVTNKDTILYKSKNTVAYIKPYSAIPKILVDDRLTKIILMNRNHVVSNSLGLL